MRTLTAALTDTRLALLSMLMVFMMALPPAQAQTDDSTYSSSEIIAAGQTFFGAISRNLAAVVEDLFARYGRPNGYILGEEASASLVGGLRYGEGQLYTKNAGNHKVYWQGPSVGFDWGADGARSMILVYNLNRIDDLYQRYAGISGSAFIVGGLGVTALGNGEVTVVPIRSGVGVRLGANVGYIKFTRNPTWNPF